MLTKDAMKRMNEQFANKTYVAREDLHPTFLGDRASKEEPLFQKGDTLKIRVESSMDWMRVKAHRASLSREHAAGKTILYYFEDELKEDVAPEDFIKERIFQILKPVE